MSMETDSILGADPFDGLGLSAEQINGHQTPDVSRRNNYGNVTACFPSGVMQPISQEADD